MKNCKLFDLAAFGKVLRYRGYQTGELQDWKEHHRIRQESYVRKMVRTSVLLDASSTLDLWAFDTDPPVGTVDKQSLCNPPWDNTFVLLRNSLFPGGALGILIGKTVFEYTDYDVWIEFVFGFHPNGAIYVTSPEEFIEISHEGKLLSTRITPTAIRALFSFQLMHCRNIITEKHEPYRPCMPKGKRNKSPKITYHTLSISNTLVKREGSESTGDGAEKAKHVCRGNFAHYTEEKKLFGKYTGAFWRPMHVKGNAKHGIVGKEYELAGSV